MKPAKETRVVDPKSGGEKGVKDDRWDLMPWLALRYLARVFGMGCKKYAPRNWEKGYAWGLSYRAAISHIELFWRGEWKDPESGLPHLAHAAWHCLIMLIFHERKIGTDDRSRLDCPSVTPERKPGTGTRRRRKEA